MVRLPAARGRVDLRALLKLLARREVCRLLIEGGGEVIASALAAKAVDRVIWIIAPKIIGGRAAVASVGGEGVSSLAKAIPVREMSVRRLGEDWVATGRVYGHR